MQSSSHKDYSVYDFNGDDEDVESASRGFLMKFVNKGANVQQTETKDVFGIDFNGNSGDKKFNDCGTYAVGTLETDINFQEETSGLDGIVVSTSTNNDEHINTSHDSFHTGTLIPGCVRMDSLDMGGFNLGALSLRNKQLDCTLPEHPSDQEVISDEDGSMETSSLPNSASDIAENEGAIEHPTPYHCFSGYEDMKEIDMEFTVFPDHVLYGNRVATCSRLTFTSEFIKFEDLNVVGSNESFNLKCEIDDIIHIESQWSQSIETCLVILRLRPVDVLGGDNARSISGIEKLTFTVYDPQWRHKEQMITSLVSRFKDKWNTILDGVNEEDDFMGQQRSMLFLKHYFTNFDEPFEDVVYPKGDPDAVSISKRDIELLQPETFVNDTIIDFYIKYLKNKIQPEDKHRFHFFNSFFFRKLADLDKDPGSALEGKAAFQRVRKWTRKVNLFEKDYIFIPVNYNLHWSLVVICHPGDIAYFGDEKVYKAQNVPCVLHMDSIKGTHNGLKNLIQSYLCEEWKARHNESSEDISLKFSNLRFVPLELPQQENSFDCGLFLLHYVELFLEEAPVNFSPFKITKFCNFLNMDWFPPAEASHKRSTIQKLIYDLLDDQHLKIPPAACNEVCLTSEEDNAEKENVVEFLSEQCSLAKKACLGDLLSSTDGEIERTVLPPSPGVQYDKETGSVLRDFLEQGSIAGLSSDEGHRPFNQILSFKSHDPVLLPIEEDAETGEQFLFSDRSNHRVTSGIMAEPCTTSCSVQDVGAFEMSCPQEISRRSREHHNRDPSSESSSCLPLDSSDVVANDHVPPMQSGDFVECIEQEEIDRQRSGSPEICGNVPNSPASASTERLEELVVEDSQEGDCQEVNATTESEESGDSFLSFQENLTASSCQDIESTEIDNTSGKGMKLFRRTDLDKSEEQVQKRLKLDPLEVERPH